MRSSHADPYTLVGLRVTAKSRIEQSPLSDAPAVPAGAIGWCEDYDISEDHLYVDFGPPYDTVICEPSEVALELRGTP